LTCSKIGTSDCPDYPVSQTLLPSSSDHTDSNKVPSEVCGQSVFIMSVEHETESLNHSRSHSWCLCKRTQDSFLALVDFASRTVVKRVDLGGVGKRAYRGALKFSSDEDGVESGGDLVRVYLLSDDGSVKGLIVDLEEGRVVEGSYHRHACHR
jgi:hypothetical protein